MNTIKTDERDLVIQSQKRLLEDQGRLVEKLMAELDAAKKPQESNEEYHRIKTLTLIGLVETTYFTQVGCASPRAFKVLNSFRSHVGLQHLADYDLPHNAAVPAPKDSRLVLEIQKRERVARDRADKKEAPAQCDKKINLVIGSRVSGPGFTNARVTEVCIQDGETKIKVDAVDGYIPIKEISPELQSPTPAAPPAGIKVGDRVCLVANHGVYSSHPVHEVTKVEFRDGSWQAAITGGLSWFQMDWLRPA